jgi:2-desacetyl-2-hydroxyethyl bacteriochlorophyllide A dehydrogenase
VKAAVVTQPGQIGLEEVEDPTPGPRDVVIAVRSVGICGTDLHILDGHYAPTLPIIPGHEFAGTVVAIGSDVTRIAVGDAVTADPNIYCGRCFQCRHARSNQCENAKAIGVTLPGAMAEYVRAPEANCVRIPDGLDVATAALVEPISCAVHAFDVMQARFGAHFAIYGAGPMGLILTALAHRSMAASVTVIDLNPERLTWAITAGASHTTVDATTLDRPAGYDIVVDCTGAPRAIEDGISRLAAGGTYLQFGVPKAEARVTISPERLLMSELTLTGSRAVLNSFERAAELFFLGGVSPDLLISGQYPLIDVEHAFEDFRHGRGRKLQVLPHS